MRAVVFAYQDMGYVGLETLLELGVEVPAVFTHEDDPAEEIWFRSVADLARAHEIPVFTTQRPGTSPWLDSLRQWQPQFLFSFYYRRILPPPVLATASRGALNLHGSLLPRYRGRCPVNWVLVHGEEETGVTLHYMEATPDSGDIVGQKRVPVVEDDTARSLYAKLVVAAGELLREMVPRLADGTAPRTAQDASRATTFGGRGPADGRIDWQAGARRAYDLVRAVTHPYPGAFTTWRQRKVFVWAARVVDAGADPGGIPGRVTLREGEIVVDTARGRLGIARLQMEGDDEMPAPRWLRRYGLEEGERFE